MRFDHESEIDQKGELRSRTKCPSVSLPLALMPWQRGDRTDFIGLLSMKHCYFSGSPQGATKGIKVYNIVVFTAPIHNTPFELARGQRHIKP